MKEQALDLLEAGYRSAVSREIEGRTVFMFRDSDAASAVGLSTATRDTPEARTYRQVMESLLDSGAVAIPPIRAQESVGVTFYVITEHGIDMLREAGRIEQS